MPKFRYKGEKQFTFVKQMGKCVEIRCRCKDGTTTKIKPGPGETEFAPGLSVIDVTEARAVRHLRADPRFVETGP